MSLPLGQAIREVSSPDEQPSSRLTMPVRGMNYVVDYIDNLLVHSPTWENQMKTLREFFRRLRYANLTVRPA
ncbi:Zinc finger protein [Plakobranchus ocellatus]|uniref:Zinc finger protein n=1 Tax=Plakobranchus ocellatus TaxID=259542 RepID=A0AAV4CMC5_9GAST|nr:Zinc finger protein [Plakobranchus ocellatus]